MFDKCKLNGLLAAFNKNLICVINLDPVLKNNNSYIPPPKNKITGSRDLACFKDREERTHYCCVWAWSWSKPKSIFTKKVQCFFVSSKDTKQATSSALSKLLSALTGGSC